MFVNKNRCVGLGFLVLALMFLALPVSAQEEDLSAEEIQAVEETLEAPVAAPAAPDAQEEGELKDRWENLLHFINIARPDLAKSFAESIANNDAVTAKEVYLLSVENPNSLNILRKGRNLNGLESLIDSILAMIEEGYKDWRSDPEQIEESIAMMGRSLRGFAIGKERLKESGEFAIPQLLQKLTADDTPQILRERIIIMLHELGRDAVRAYRVALQSNDLKLVEFVANALGQIEYPSAVPALREAMLREDLQDPDSTARRAVIAALISCAGGNRGVLERSPAELFYELGEKYYDHAESLMPDIRYPNEPAFVWFWKEGLGVESIAVPRSIFADVYAMRMARKALQYDTSYYPAVPLWLSACIRREIDLPDGATDPLWPADWRRPAYYALASPPRYLKLVLARALEDNNAAIARNVISAMSRTTGAQSLVQPLPGGGMPLVSAMSYPDRNVRFLAAETLALAMPTEHFHGYQMVMPLLSEALRQQGKQYAMVIVQDEELRNTVKDAIRAGGYEVVEETELDNMLSTARKARGLDVVFTGPTVSLETVVRSLRSEPVFLNVPVVHHRAGTALRRLAESDGKVVLLEEDKNDQETIVAALAEAMNLSAGSPMDAQQSMDWALRTARVLRTVGQRAGVIYDLSRTVDALVEATAAENAELKQAAAEALAVIQSAKAQRAIVDMAMDAELSEELRIAAFQAATGSVRRFGNETTDQQSEALVDMVGQTGGSEPLMQAAAQLLGAMNLPSQRFPSLILDADKID